MCIGISEGHPSKQRQESDPGGCGSCGLQPLPAPAVGPDSNFTTAFDCRRPIQEWEVPYLKALGQELRALRLEAGITQEALAVSTGLSSRSLRRLERGERRTRYTTLARLSVRLSHSSSPERARDLLDRLLTIAGPALAPESQYAERLDMRRERRARRQRDRWVSLHRVEIGPSMGGYGFERHTRSQRPGAGRVATKTYEVLRGPDGYRSKWTVADQFSTTSVPPNDRLLVQLLYDAWRS
ncbi:helix-turn-helix domain-containing protein [Humibacillus xanthopallidus]|uniref:helix-turn-helix domain-containing protein n=1 Tax=Humibacillus xanthopallidus TaxID=412689 RepID=UPI00384EED77